MNYPFVKYEKRRRPQYEGAITAAARILKPREQESFLGGCEGDEMSNVCFIITKRFIIIIIIIISFQSHRVRVAFVYVKDPSIAQGSASAH